MSVLRNKVNKILLAIKNGDEESKSVLFEETYNHLKYIAYKYISDKNYIEDIIVNSYIKIFASIKHFDSGKDGYNWLCKAVQNEAYTFNRKNKTTLSIDEQPNVSVSTDFSEYVAEKDELERMLSEYDMRDRE